MKTQFMRSLLPALCCVLVSCEGSQQSDEQAAATDSAQAAADTIISVALHDSLFGVVGADRNTTCLRVPRLAAQSTDSVLVVIPLEMRAIKARVTEPLDACPDQAPTGQLTYYRLDTPEFRQGDLGIAIITDAVQFFRGGRTDIDGDGAAETYRACTSAEGVHLSVWAGEPLESPRVWHYYYPLGYKVEPSCVAADTAGVANAPAR
jgi:hypothetical protein